jgi:ubiquinone biosynthesis protein
LALEELGPTFVKLGQVLSTRPDLLPPAYITELTKLQDSVPPAPWEDVREIIIQDLADKPEQIFSELNPEPMAAASLAQVYRACLPGGENVIVKVQRPDITEVIQTDLEILSELAAVAQLHCTMSWIIVARVATPTVFDQTLPAKNTCTSQLFIGITPPAGCWFSNASKG